MDRENYYLLLELSVDPPEQDTKVIAAAVREKQAEWSRNRNHPTKSMQAKRYIGMLPDIKRIMIDPKLRKQEAEAAVTRMKKSETDLLDRVDRHLALLMTKGRVTKKELAGLPAIDEVDPALIRERLKKNELVFKLDFELDQLLRQEKGGPKALGRLAKKFGLSREKVQERMEKRRQDKFHDLDHYLQSCSERGFITETAIQKLSRTLALRENQILDRLECPIRRDTGVPVRRPKPLDSTLVRLIDENLRILGKSSLYEFLDMPTNAPIDVLQEVAKEKEIEIRRMAQKDAVATASGALAGHCIVIFRSNKSRSAYDMTRNLTKLAEFNQDIRVAGMESKILAPYLEFLSRESLRIGMDFEEALEYIREFAHREKWKVEERIKLFQLRRDRLVIQEKWNIEFNPKKPAFWGLLAGFAVLAALIFAGSVFTLNMLRASRIAAAYEKLESTIDQQPSPDQKQRMLRDFLSRYGQTEYAPKIRQRLSAIDAELEKRDFAATMEEVRGHYAAEAFEDATKTLEWYMKKYPSGARTDEIRKELESIPARIDNRDYQRVLKAAEGGDYAGKIQAYNRYFELHPQGQHIDDVRRLILEMVDSYYQRLQASLADCEGREDWDACMALAEDFIQRFAGTQQAEAVAGLRVKYEKQRQYEKDLAILRDAAVEQLRMMEFETAKQIYSRYLEANPEAPGYLRRKIAAAVEELERRHQAYLAAEKEWEELISFARDRLAPIDERVRRLEAYTQRNPEGRHTPQAQSLLAELTQEKLALDERQATEREQREWASLLAHSRNSRVSLEDRIARLRNYLAGNRPAKFAEGAQKLLAQLQEEKRAADERREAQRDRQARIARENQRVTALAVQSGRFAAGRQGTVTDQRTGLIWTTVDSYVDLGQCVDYDTAGNYVSQLNTGGYSNWRMPTVEELAGIYKTRPFFPPGDASWYWTSEIIWHGWNKKAIVVTTQQETAWSKLQIELTKCGAVRPVRDR